MHLRSVGKLHKLIQLEVQSKGYLPEEASERPRKSCHHEIPVQ